MTTETKPLPKSEVLITVQLTKELHEKYESQAAARVSARIDVPGFRRGQAPKAFIMAQIGPEAFFQEFLSVAVPQSYFQAIKEKALQTISRPDIRIIENSPLKYEAKVGVLPEISINGLDLIKVDKTAISVSDSEIEDVIAEMRRYRATYQPLTREIQKGDRVEIDFQGFDESGAALEKTKSTNHPLFVGENTLVPGFEESLIGMKVSEKKKFPLPFPKDYHYEPLRGKTVHFEVELKRAEEPILPAFDEAFIEQILGEKKTVAEFQEVVKKDLHYRKTMDDRKSRENAFIEKLLKNAQFDVPPILIEEEVEAMVEDLRKEIESRKLKFEHYLEKLKKENRDIRKEYRAEAEKRIRIRLVLNHLFQTLKIEVSDEEMKKACDALIASAPAEEKEKAQKNIFEKGSLYLRLKNNLMLEKLFAKFLD